MPVRLKMRHCDSGIERWSPMNPRAELIAAWDETLAAFHKVMPKDYKRVLEVMRQAEEQDLPEAETLARVMASSHG